MALLLFVLNLDHRQFPFTQAGPQHCTFDLTEPFRDHETGILDGFLLYFCRGLPLPLNFIYLFFLIL